MDFDPSQMLGNPWLNFGMGMLGASAPSTDPRSGSLAYAMSQGLNSMQKGNALSIENQRSQQYARMMQEAIKAKAEREKEEKENKLASMMDPELWAAMLQNPEIAARVRQLLGGSPDVPGYMQGLY